MSEMNKTTDVANVLSDDDVRDSGEKRNNTISDLAEKRSTKREEDFKRPLFFYFFTIQRFLL